MKGLTPHPQADILQAIADGKTVQMSNEDYEWVDADLKCLVNYPTGAFRIKPETININGREVPCPVREPLQEGDVYFIANLYNESFVTSNTWTECSAAMLWLGRGLIHLTPEAAIAHAEALLSFTRSDK